MSQYIDDDSLNRLINNYLKRRNYSSSNQSQSLNDNKFTIRELIANEFVLNIGSYDHLVGFTTNQTDYYNDSNRCLDELFTCLDNLSLDNETRLSFSFAIFIHLFIDLFQNDFKQYAKLFFNKHHHKFICFSQLKKTIDLIQNSIRTQQLDKRLIKLRNSKISISVTESDHRLLLSYLQNDSLSKSLHQIINQNFAFSILSDQSSIERQMNKSSTDHSINLLQSDGPEVCFKDFNSLFLNGKLNEESNDSSDKLDGKMCDRMETNFGSRSIDQTTKDLIEEFDDLVNSLKSISPQLPEVLTYKLSTNDCHICCADLRSDLRYCCAGTENSEVLVFYPELKANYDFKSKYISPDEIDQQTSLIEEKQERNLNKSYSFYGHYGSVVDLKFVPNTNYLLTCSNDHTSILWNLNEKESNNYLKKKFYGHTQPIYSLDVNCLGTHFATGSKDYTSRLFSLDRSNLLRSFIGHQNSINCVHFHPNSNYLATGSSDHSIRMWDISASNMVRVFNCQTEIYSLCYSTDGQYLASAGADSKIKIWDLTNGKLLTEFNSSHTKPVNSLSFNSTSTILVSSSIDQQVNFWNFKIFKQETRNETLANDSLMLNKNLLVKLRRSKFTHSDLLAAIGT